MNKYALRCMAPDGDTVREGEFPSVEAAWGRSQDMGSRWFFYPVHIVTGPSRSDRARIIDTPRELSAYKGRTVRSLARDFASNPDRVCAWINDGIPFSV